jgi:hypothetical protein
LEATIKYNAQRLSIILSTHYQCWWLSMDGLNVGTKQTGMKQRLNPSEQGAKHD